jgi:hypothetical protein
MTNPKATQQPEGKKKQQKKGKGDKKPTIMLVGVTLKRISQSILVIFARKTTGPISALGLWRPRIYWHNNSLLC